MTSGTRSRLSLGVVKLLECPTFLASLDSLDRGIKLGILDPAFMKGLSVNVTTFRNFPSTLRPYVLPALLIPVAHGLNLVLVSKFSFSNLRSVIEVDRYSHPVQRPQYPLSPMQARNSLMDALYGLVLSLLLKKYQCSNT
ncbi:hypothetical protein [Metallosphaera sedula]|uniref:hypothetical protein n=1 Tax=Metallosphaera sedula TaxID=43687 RepID=UPI0020BF9A4A|nr:hypothetical protein [Metallosphaera sedula]BBL47981.1 hypothetical protein MJ1HA_2096 [Metallosphaera sedula]